MDINGSYLIKRCLEIAPNGKILDYGCGSGELVALGRANRINIVGVDIFYGGNNSLEIVKASGKLGKTIFQIPRDFKIPFPQNYFDLIISKQVIEHVQDIQLAFSEINRVLKTNGRFLAIFPDKGTIREGHCGVPFAHWFKKESKVRYPYILAMRILGFGYHKNKKPITKWAHDFIEYLDTYTNYKTFNEIKKFYAESGMTMISQEYDFLTFRINCLGLKLPKNFQNQKILKTIFVYICRKFSGLVILAQKK